MFEFNPNLTFAYLVSFCSYESAAVTCKHFFFGVIETKPVEAETLSPLLSEFLMTTMAPCQMSAFLEMVPNIGSLISRIRACLHARVAYMGSRIWAMILFSLDAELWPPLASRSQPLPMKAD